MGLVAMVSDFGPPPPHSFLNPQADGWRECGYIETFPELEELPPRMWNMLLVECPDLEDLTLCSFSSSKRLFDLRPISQGMHAAFSIRSFFLFCEFCFLFLLLFFLPGPLTLKLCCCCCCRSLAEASYAHARHVWLPARLYADPALGHTIRPGRAREQLFQQ